MTQPDRDLNAGTGDPEDNVVRFPLDWIGSLDELVPIAEPTVSAQDFWGEASGVLHQPVQAPPSLRSEPLPAAQLAGPPSFALRVATNEPPRVAPTEPLHVALTEPLHVAPAEPLGPTATEPPHVAAARLASHPSSWSRRARAWAGAAIVLVAVLAAVLPTLRSEPASITETNTVSTTATTVSTTAAVTQTAARRPKPGTVVSRRAGTAATTLGAVVSRAVETASADTATRPPESADDTIAAETQAQAPAPPPTVDSPTGTYPADPGASIGPGADEAR